ncbi:MAG: hypothetical protein V3T72_12100 [Thermoanaerobaculia bacterium]
MDPDEHPEPVSARLVFFPPGTDPRRRRRRTLFAAVYVVAAVMVTWPVYSLFSGTFPLILGLPLSLAWILLALTVIFCALLWLYRSDRPDEDA